MKLATLVLLSLALTVVGIAVVPEASARCEDNPLEPGTYCEGVVSRTMDRVTCQNPRCE